MVLKTEIINTRNSLKRNFSLREQYEVNICILLSAYKAFIMKLAPITGVDSLLLNNINDKGCYVFPAQPQWLDEGKIDPDTLISSLKGLSAPLCPAFIEADNAARIRRLAEPVACNEEAALLYLFLLLHIQSCRCIDEEDMEYMAARLADLRQTIYEQNRIPMLPHRIPGTQWSLQLPPVHNGDPRIEVIAGTGLALQVSIDTTHHRRTLFYNEAVMALHLNGHCPIFLSRSRRLTQDADIQALCARILRACRSLPDVSEPLLKPILDDKGCAGWLTQSGCVIADGHVLAQGVLDAAADDRVFFLALSDGVAAIPRDGSRPLQYLIKKSTPVEEIDLMSGQLCYRTSSGSTFYTITL